MKCLFVSDVHYPISGDIFLKFLWDNYTYFDRIYLLGDIFEFYFGYKNFIYKHHIKLLTLLKVILKKTELYIFEGNHEYRLEGLRQFMDAHIIKRSLEEKFDGLRVYMEHGDMVDKEDIKYMMFRNALKNRFTLRIIEHIKPSLLLSLSKKASHFSKTDIKSKKSRHTDDALEKFANSKIKSGIDVVILAHTHNPILIKKNNGIYINTGDFLEHFTYATYETGRGFSLHNYRGDDNG